MSLLLPLALGGLAVAVLVVAMAESMMARRAVTRTLRQATWDDPEFARVRDRELAQSVGSRVVIPGVRRLNALVLRFTPRSSVERLDELLIQAGSPIGWDGERILALKGLTLVAFAFGSFIVFQLLGVALPQLILLVPAAGFIGYYLPEWLVRSRASVRQDQIRRALPDALDLLSITVEAGLGFDSALDRVAREIRGPLGAEFYRSVQEMRLGKGRAAALRDMGERSTVPELKSFTLAMVQAEMFGISVANVLHVQASELRVKRRQRAEEEAQKLPVKIIFPLVLCIFPTLFAVLLGPAAIRIFDSFNI